MPWGLIGAAVIGGLSAASQGSKQRDSTEAINETQIELANTAHQREYKDLVAAGLNPILAANKGAAVPPLQVPQYPNLGEHAMGAFRGAVGAKRELAETDLTKQKTAIGEPMAKIAEHTARGIDSLVDIVKMMTSKFFGAGGVADKIGEFKMPDISVPNISFGDLFKRHAENWSIASAGGAERFPDVAERFARLNEKNDFRTPWGAGDVVEHYLRQPRKWFEDAVKPAQRSGDLRVDVPGLGRVHLTKDAFSGDRRKDLAAIAAVKDPRDRAVVQRIFRMWQDHYGVSR